jgi:TadE-like protein
MRCRSRFDDRTPRGVAMVEMALVLPLLLMLFVAGVDFARVFFCAVTITNCAANGASYASQSVFDPKSPYTSTKAAALADAGDLSPTPNVSSASGVDPSGNSYVEVTVTYPFRTLINWPGISSLTTVSRTVRMLKSPDTPAS